MSTCDLTTTWTHGSPQSKLTAKRTNQSFSVCAADHVDTVLNGGSSTDPASGASGPFTHVVVWSAGGIEFTTTARSFVSQEEADDLAEALKDEVLAAGGTVISG